VKERNGCLFSSSRPPGFDLFFRFFFAGVFPPLPKDPEFSFFYMTSCAHLSGSSNLPVPFSPNLTLTHLMMPTRVLVLFFLFREVHPPPPFREPAFLHGDCRGPFFLEIIRSSLCLKRCLALFFVMVSARPPFPPGKMVAPGHSRFSSVRPFFPYGDLCRWLSSPRPCFLFSFFLNSKKRGDILFFRRALRTPKQGSPPLIPYYSLPSNPVRAHPSLLVVHPLFSQSFIGFSPLPPNPTFPTPSI